MSGYWILALYLINLVFAVLNTWRAMVNVRNAKELEEVAEGMRHWLVKAHALMGEEVQP